MGLVPASKTRGAGGGKQARGGTMGAGAGVRERLLGERGALGADGVGSALMHTDGIHTYMHTSKHTYMHTSKHTYMHTCIDVCRYVCTCIHTCVCVCMYYIHAYITYGRN